MTLALAALSLAFAPAPFLPRKAPPVESDEQILQGEWTEMDSSNLAKPSSADVKYVFSGKDVTVLQTGKVVSRWTMTLGPAATPRRMDLAGVGGGRLPYLYTLKTDGPTLRLVLQGRGEFMRPRR